MPFAFSADSFMIALATAIAAAASPALEFTSPPLDLFVYELVEASSKLKHATPGPASVLRLYDGETPYVPTELVSVQCMTTAVLGSERAGMQRAVVLHNTLLDSDSRPRRMWTVGNFRVNGILNLQQPAQIGRDENQRLQFVFNFDCQVVPTA